MPDHPQTKLPKGELHYEHCTHAYEAFSKEFKKNHEPISVDFRQILDTLPGNLSRYTHNIHSYPAKLLYHIPLFFLNSPVSAQCKNIFDPFCGTGTVLLEGKIRGFDAFGADLNPIARMIAETKLTHLPGDLLRRHLKAILARIQQKGTKAPQDIFLQRWFDAPVLQAITAIKESCERTRDPDVRRFFLVCLSAIIKKLSLADPRISVPVKLKKSPPPGSERGDNRLSFKQCITLFENLSNANITRLDTIEKISHVKHTILEDAKNLTRSNGKKFPSNSFDLIITSPPYNTAQKYIRSCSLSLAVLGHIENGSIADMDRLLIGSEKLSFSRSSHIEKTGIISADNLLDQISQKNAKRAFLASQYLIGMRDALVEMKRLLRKDRSLVLIIGNNQVGGYEFHTKSYLTEMAMDLGFTRSLELTDRITSRGLMTKRNKTAGLIESESVIVFKNEDR